MSKGVDGARAWAHAKALLDRYPALSETHLAKIAGVSHSLIGTIKNGGRLTSTSEEYILAVRDEHIAMLPPPNMPLGPARDHLMHLLSIEGVSCSGVGHACGITPTTIRWIRAGKWATLRYPTYAAVMSVTEEQALGMRGYYPRWQSVTRVRALQANGWPMEAIATMAGLTSRIALSKLMQHDSPDITATMALRIKEAYDRIGDARGPSRPAAACGKRLGYYPPIHYDDDMRLIPGSVPGLARPRHQITAEENLRCRLRLRALALTLQGHSVTEVVERLQMERKSVERARRNVGLHMVSTTAWEDGTVVPAPGQADLVAAIERRLKGIEWQQEADSYDDEGIDYRARWKELKTGAWREVDAPEEEQVAS